MISIQKLPHDILLHVFSYIDLKTYPALFRVSKLWKSLAESIKLSPFNYVKNFSGKPSIIWQKDDVKLNCLFINDKFFLLGSYDPKKCVLVSRVNFSEKKFNDYQFHKSYGDFLIFSHQLKLIVLDSKSGEELITCDVSQNLIILNNQLITMSQIDQNGQFQIIDRHYHLFFFKIKIDKNNTIFECITSVDLSQYLKLPLENTFESAYFRDDFLVLSYRTINYPFTQGYIITFKDNIIVRSTYIPPNWLQFYVFDSNKIFGRVFNANNPPTECVEFLENTEGKWIVKWEKPNKAPYTIYGDIVISTSHNNNDYHINSFDQEGNMKELIIKDTSYLKTNVYHQGLLFLFFQQRFYIYNPGKAQLEGNLNGYTFECEKNINSDKPIQGPDGPFFSFYEFLDNHVTKSGIVSYQIPPSIPCQLPSPASPEILSKKTSPSQKLLVLKVVIVVGAIFVILSIATLLSLRFSASLVFPHAIHLKISIAAIAILGSSSLVAGLILHKKYKT